MPEHSVHKATDLARDERLLVERWLGRALSNDETISVKVYRPHSAPASDEREALRREIVTQAQEIGSRAQDANDKSVDSLIDEAFGAARVNGSEIHARLQHPCSSGSKPARTCVACPRYRSPCSHSRSVAVNS